MALDFIRFMSKSVDKQIKISPSGISYLLECPRCLWLHMNEDRKRPRGAYPSLPDGMDNVFKKYFDEYRSRHELPPEIEGKVGEKIGRKTLCHTQKTRFKTSKNYRSA